MKLSPERRRRSRPGWCPTTIAQARRSSEPSIVRRRSEAHSAFSRRTISTRKYGQHGDQRPGVKGDVERLVERLVVLQEVVVLEPGDQDQMTEEEIGRNSVSPWTIPSSSASRSDMRRRIVALPGRGAKAASRVAPRAARPSDRSSSRRVALAAFAGSPRRAGRGRRGTLGPHRRQGRHLLGLRRDGLLRGPGHRALADPDPAREPQGAPPPGAGAAASARCRVGAPGIDACRRFATSARAPRRC